jgi:predicted NBD/HSP70 family sugar kinase
MSQGHATLTTVRATNATVALEAIRRNQPLSRAEVARQTGMTRPTASAALDLLLAAGLVREVDPPRETHYGATFFAPVADTAFILGLDIGGRFVRGALGDLDGRTVARCDIAIDDSMPQTIVDAVQGIRRHVGVDKPIELVVAGVPGVVDRAGILRASNPPELEGAPITDLLASSLAITVLAENDINLAALGELAAGHGRGVFDFAFLSVGTGVGAGLVLGGRLHRGHRGAAGEVDNPPSRQQLAPDSPSADALVHWATQWIVDDPITTLTLPVTPERVFEAAKEGDTLAARILDEQSRRIAVRVADISRVVDTELVVLGGGIGLACAGQISQIEQHLCGLLVHPPRVTVSGLGEEATLTGAITHGAFLVRDTVTARRIAGAAA